MELLRELMATLADALRYGDWPGHWEAFQQARRAAWYPPDGLDTGKRETYHLTTTEEA